MASSHIDLTGDDDMVNAAPQQQDMYAVAIHCGAKGLAVCAVSTDPKVWKKAQRKYVVQGFELVKDAAYCGNYKRAALQGMLQRSQTLQTVLAHNPKAYVVLRKHVDFPGADHLAQKAIERGQWEAEKIATSIRQHHPQAQLLDMLRDSASTAVQHFLQHNPKKQAKAAVAGSTAAATGSAANFSSSDYGKVQRRTSDGLVNAARQFLGSDKCSWVDGVSDPVAELDKFQKPVDNHRDMATSFWMSMYVMSLAPGRRDEAVQLTQANLGVAAATAAAAAPAAATPSNPAPAPVAAPAPAGAPAAVLGNPLALPAPPAAAASLLLAAHVQAQTLAALLGAAAAPVTGPAAQAHAQTLATLLAAAAANAGGTPTTAPVTGPAAPASGAAAAVSRSAAPTLLPAAAGLAGTQAFFYTPQSSQRAAAAAAAAVGGGGHSDGRVAGGRRRQHAYADAAAAAAAGADTAEAGPTPLMPHTQPQGVEGPAAAQQHRQHKRRKSSSAALGYRSDAGDVALPLVQQPGSPPSPQWAPMAARAAAAAAGAGQGAGGGGSRSAAAAAGLIRGSQDNPICLSDSE